MNLVWPAAPYLAGIKAALARGWSPDKLRAEAAREELEKIDGDPRITGAFTSPHRRFVA